MTSVPKVRRAAVLGCLFTLMAARSAPAIPLPPGPVMGYPADYVIVTPSAFASEFQRLAKWKTRLGIPAYVKTLESIQSEYPGGRDDAERVRLFLKDAKAQWNTHWILLGGATPFMPVRRVHTTFYGNLDFASDYYFSDLDGSWDADADNVFGEGYLDASQPGDALDLHADVFVGRAPVRTPAEVHAFVDKTLRVSFVPYVPAPRRVLLAADVLFPQAWSAGIPITFDGGEITEPVRDIAVAQPGVAVQRLYENWNDPRWPDAQPLTRAALLASLRAGADWFVSTSFGTPTELGAGNELVSLADLDGLGDAARPAQAWLMGSLAANPEDDGVAAHLVRGATGGAATCVGVTTYSFPTALRQYLQEFAIRACPPSSKAVGEANARSVEPYIPFTNYDGVNRLCVMSLALVGDPETHLQLAPPVPIAASHPAELLAGSAGFDVDASAAGSPLAGARVCALLDGEALAIATTDAGGHAHLDFAAAHAGAAQLTITAADGGRYEAEIPVIEALGVGDGGAGRFGLGAPKPNPSFASVRLAGAVAGPAALEIFDVGGRHVRTFALEAGRFDLRWDLADASGRPVPAGLYLARLASAEGFRTQRLLVAR